MLPKGKNSLYLLFSFYKEISFVTFKKRNATRRIRVRRVLSPEVLFQSTVSQFSYVSPQLHLHISFDFLFTKTTEKVALTLVPIAWSPKTVGWDAVREKELEKKEIPQLEMQSWIHCSQ